MAVILAGLAGAGSAVSACSSPNGPARTTQSVPSSSSSATPSSTTSTTLSAGAGAARCAASELSGSVSGTQGAAGTIEVTVRIQNTATDGCTLDGDPSVQLIGSGGSELPTAVVRGGAYQFTDFAAQPVMLAAQAVAYFNLAYSDVTSGSTACSSSASMWVTPPGDADYLTVTQAVTACDGGQITVSPIFGAGSSETDTTAP
ncbi:MAG TPA: DUF4232 domain-containing protein [Acidimicrobiales bacterium]|nr:DUF4232 domain-containing protein [Acidimicrobiales bacterium]